MAIRDNKGKFVKGHKSIVKGGKRPKFHGNLGSFKKGESAWNKNTKGIMKQNKTSFKKGIVPWNKDKGIIGKLNELQRHREEYRLWRISCFERDNYTCQKTKVSGGRLVVHHINNFAEKIELRFAIDNGITLSDKSHREFHKLYGRKNNTLEQILEFINLN
jgi:hypothetical protein